uniref:CSON009067 protein n=1 Tax=Culicoides sonorensis TaxID=179676 RepID=A0A336MZF2_CULSO
MHLTVDLSTEHVWAISLHSTILNLDLQSEKNPIKEYSTLNSRINQFSINPIDPNVIAIACNKRISLLNVSKLNENYVFMDGMANQVHSQVLTVAWHPEKENLLGFSTREGRIGIFDTTKLQNCPTIMKPFFSKDVYSVTWAKFTTKVSEEPTWHLFCCGFAGQASHLVYYPQNGNGKFVPTQVKHFQNVTSTLASQEYLAIGCFDGTVHLADLSDVTLAPFYSQKLGSKLISGFCFSTNKLAVASFDHDITILHIESKENITFQKFKGHKSGVTSVNWSLKNPELLVSTSSDCTVRIWNINDTNNSAEEKLATFERDTFAAIFYPTNDNLVIVGGANFMMTIFNYKETSIDLSRQSNKNAAKPLMASIDEANVVKKAKKEKKKNLLVQKRLERSLKDQENSINRTEEEVINGIKEIHLDEIPKSDQNDLGEQSGVSSFVQENTKDLSIAKSDKNKKDSSIQFNYSSIFFLTPRELNRDPIAMLKNLVESKEEDEKKWHLRHEKLFSLEQNVVKSLLNEEYSHQIASNAQSVGLLTLPMLTMDIKSVILEKISQKTLTEEYIAVAPFISHTFWRNTCLAFAHQCVEQGLVLKAISYFLCCYDVNDAISVLCQSNNYTEAMAIAKMRKSENDPIFKDIVQKWTKYLDYCGNFEGAAIVWMAFGDNKSALEVLKKRSNPDEDLMKIIDKLKDLNGEPST